jgi:hypothetical protein
MGLKLTVNTNSVAHDDLDDWIDSYNSLWRDWQAIHGGTLGGEFVPIKYKSYIEAELHIPIISGFGLLLGGSQINSQADGQINYNTSAGDQRETHAIMNRIEALPFKIGLCFRTEIIPRLSVSASLGRHILFVQYKVKEEYEAVFTGQGERFSYWYDKEATFNSEALGIFASLGAGYELFKYLDVVVEIEQIWNTVDGFKGSFSTDDYLGQADDGKASLYFYESQEFGLEKFYSVLAGHEDRPEGETVRNVRQGELDFDGISIKIGLRLKF